MSEPQPGQNDLMAAALKTYLKMHRRKQINAAFVAMANDADYQKQAMLLAEDLDHQEELAFE